MALNDSLYVLIYCMVCSIAIQAIVCSSLENEDRGEKSVTTLLGGKLEHGLKGDVGVLHQKRKHRLKRDTVGSRQGSAGAGIGQTLLAPNYQASYFVGQCYMCPPGPAGSPGPQGIQGTAGRDGRDALLVASSDDSSNHATYTRPQVSPPERNQTGVTYIRWGKTTCSSSSELVYHGVVAGSLYTNKGGGANHLCLPHNPVFDRPVSGYQGSKIYGAEYEISSNFPPLPGIYDTAVPCAVCFCPSKSHTLMVPGTNRCPEGKAWTKEYNGYILTAHHDHRRSEYLCFDHQAKGIPRTTGNQNEALFYVVEVTCSVSTGIPCPPYVNGYELTCVVCSI